MIWIQFNISGGNDGIGAVGVSIERPMGPLVEVLGEFNRRRDGCGSKREFYMLGFSGEFRGNCTRGVCNPQGHGYRAGWTARMAVAGLLPSLISSRFSFSIPR